MRHKNKKTENRKKDELVGEVNIFVNVMRDRESVVITVCTMFFFLLLTKMYET